MDSIFKAGLDGMQRSLQSTLEHVGELGRAFSEEGSGNIIDPIVGLQSDELQFRASAEVIKVGKQLTGTILDILA